MNKNLAIISALVCIASLTSAPSAVALGRLKNRIENRAFKKTEESVRQQPQQPTAADSAPCISWISPLVKPKFALLCIHGLGLYSKAYTDFGTRISRKGAAVYAIDVRGFGAWMNSAGHKDIDFDACLQDIKVAITAIRKANPGLPVFLLGESMGGAIALRAASIYPDMIDGLISSVPAGERFQQKRTDLKVAIEFLKGPKKQFDMGSQVVEQASTVHVINPETGKKEKIVNEKLLDDWQNDPLDRMNLSAKELLQFQVFMDENHDSVKKILRLPVLFVQGIDDRLVRPDGTWELFKDLSTQDRTFLSVASRHLIFEQAQDNNPDLKQTAYSMVLSWILAQINADDGSTTIYSQNQYPADGQADLNTAIENLTQGNVPLANQQLQTLLQRDPSNPEVHYWIGMSLMKKRAVREARMEFQTAIRLSNGAGQAKLANQELLSMAPISAPQQAPLTRAAVSPAVLNELTRGKPTVIAFYANWIDQYGKLESMITQLQSQFGNRVTFQKINVADAQNADLVKSFDVGPVPTLVFLKPNGYITSTMIGQSSPVAVGQGVIKMLRTR